VIGTQKLQLPRQEWLVMSHSSKCFFVGSLCKLLRIFDVVLPNHYTNASKYVLSLLMVADELMALRILTNAFCMFRHCEFVIPNTIEVVHGAVLGTMASLVMEQNSLNVFFITPQ
jgi:hypothetical protein